MPWAARRTGPHASLASGFRGRSGFARKGSGPSGGNWTALSALIPLAPLPRLADPSSPSSPSSGRRILQRKWHFLPEDGGGGPHGAAWGPRAARGEERQRENVHFPPRGVGPLPYLAPCPRFSGEEAGTAALAVGERVCRCWGQWGHGPHAARSPPGCPAIRALGPFLSQQNNRQVCARRPSSSDVSPNFIF